MQFNWHDVYTRVLSTFVFLILIIILGSICERLQGMVMPSSTEKSFGKPLKLLLAIYDSSLLFDWLMTGVCHRFHI